MGLMKCQVLLILPYAAEKIDPDRKKHTEINGKSIPCSQTKINFYT